VSWATTPKMRGSPGGFGLICVQVTPLSRLMAKPQSVATYTLALPVSKDIPQAPAKPTQPGFDPGGFVQVAPSSVLRQMPP